MSLLFLDNLLDQIERLGPVALIPSGQPQLSFKARAGLHRYRIRISALWRWYRGGKFRKLRLRGERAFTLQKAHLLAEQQH